MASKPSEGPKQSAPATALHLPGWERPVSCRVVELRSSQDPIYSNGRLVDCRGRKAEAFGDGPLFRIGTRARFWAELRVALDEFGLEKAAALLRSGEWLEGAELRDAPALVIALPPLRVEDIDWAGPQGARSTVLLRGATEAVRAFHGEGEGAGDDEAS